MSIWDRLTKNVGRLIQKVAPIAAIVAPFIPGVGPILAGVLGTVGAAAATPGIAPPSVVPRVMPGAGATVPAAARRIERRPATSLAKTIKGFGASGGLSGALRRAVPTPGVKTIAPPGAAFGGLRGPTPTALPARPIIQPSAQVTNMSIFASLPAIGTAARGAAGAIGRVLGSRTATAASAGALVGTLLPGGGGNGACPSGWHLNKQDGVGGAAGTYCVRNRRMNVGNARAARRSVRRLKGARKLLRDIEKMMPSKPRARRAPVGHTSQLTHTGS